MLRDAFHIIIPKVGRFVTTTAMSRDQSDLGAL